MIAQLPEETSRAIRAQQYINDSYIIVKELVENALDARASEIRVDFAEECIVVDDNGEGIEDLNSVCVPGSTSKGQNTLKVLGLTADDTIPFMHGFRGQALASIAELSDVEISSKPRSYKQDQHGLMRNYATRTIKRVPRQYGTTVRVTRLFKNSPVRRTRDRKLHKKTLLRLVSLLDSFCYIYDVSFTLSSNSKVLFAATGASDTKAYAIKKHGTPFFELCDDQFEFILFPLSKEKQRHIFFEKRPVQSQKLVSSIDTMFKRRFTYLPTFVLVLKGEADINLSVDKTEIMLRNYTYVEMKLRERLNEYFNHSTFLVQKEERKEKESSEPRAPDAQLPEVFDRSFANLDGTQGSLSIKESLDFDLDPLSPGYVEAIMKNDAYKRSLGSSNTQGVPEDSADKKAVESTHWSSMGTMKRVPKDFSSLQLKREDFKSLVIIGQFNHGFILCTLKTDTGTFLVVVDQHAADEIYNFETLQDSFSLKRQSLINPVELSLLPSQEILIEAHADVFERNGFVVCDRKLLTIPVYKNYFFTLADFYSLLENVSCEVYLSDKFREIMASKACRSSIMIGTALPEKKMREILDHLGTIKRPWNCPHGRPTIQILMKL